MSHAAPHNRSSARGRAAGGFTLAEAAIASGFVGIALAGVLSLAPAMIRGQHEIALRARAHAAATELLGMFERQELFGMQPADAEVHVPGTPQKGLVGTLLGALLPLDDGVPPDSPDPVPITHITTTIHGVQAELSFITIDPVTLTPDPASTTAALITIVISVEQREIARLHTIRTDAWTRADNRRAFEP